MRFLTVTKRNERDPNPFLIGVTLRVLSAHYNNEKDLFFVAVPPGGSQYDVHSIPASCTDYDAAVHDWDMVNYAAVTSPTSFLFRLDEDGAVPEPVY